MKKTFLILSLFLFLAVPLSHPQETETITLTTYYPAPYGVYKDMRVTGRLAVGDVNRNNEMDNGDFAAEEETLTVAGKVGIGTTAPRAPSPDDTHNGLLDVHDAYIRAANEGAGQWVSQIMRTGPVTGMYSGDGSGNDRKITLGFRPKMLLLTAW